MAHRYDVFLSHSSADKDAVEKLARKLRRARLSPFLDKWHLVPGEPWQEALEVALKESRTCAVFLGPGDSGRATDDGRSESGWPDRDRWGSIGEVHFFDFVVPE